MVRKAAISTAFIALLAAIGVLLFGNLSYRELYSEFRSPDGAYFLRVFVRNEIGMPGQSGDRRALVKLVDKSGRTLREMPVEMAQLVDDPEWTEANVEVKLILDWQLPAAH